MVRRALVLFLPLLLLGAACSDDEPDTESASSSSSSSTSETSEAPGTTDGSSPAPSVTTTPEGSGTPLTGAGGTGDIDYTLVPERSEFCYRISVRDLGEITEAHVHRANGEVVLGLQHPTTGSTIDTCAATDALLIEEMSASPGDFYIDVHGAKGVLKATL